MVSGGGDSVALLDVARAARRGCLGAPRELRAARRTPRSDEALVRTSSASELGMPLRSSACELGSEGNLQERARDARYALAEGLAAGDYAAAHTASDQAETVLYRLAVSPGSRALHGMSPRRGRLVRPLLAVTREEVREYLRARGLEWREDPSNADRRFARARVRHDVIDALRELSPAAERTIAETARQLREEAEVLDAVVAEAMKELGGGPACCSLPCSSSRRPCAGSCCAKARRPERSRSRELDEILALGERGTKSLDLGGGLRAVSEYGTLRFTRSGRRRHAGPGAAHGARPRALRRLGGRGAPRRPGRRGRERPRPRADRARLARRRPHAPRRPRRIEVAPGPVHRPEGPARAAPHASRGGVRRRDRLGGRGGGGRALRGGGGRRGRGEPERAVAPSAA